MTLDDEGAEPLTLEFNALHLALSVYGGTIHETHFAAQDRKHLKGSVDPEDITSISYRGKSVYRTS